jgi:hypothetical protein
MNAEQLTVIAGAILSLAFSYIPGLKTSYARSQHLARFEELALTFQNCKPKSGNSVLRDSEEKLHN